jgi:hypothetical protein
MTEENYKKYDLWIRALSPLVTFAGILIGIYQFQKGQTLNLEKELHMKRIEVRYKQLEIKKSKYSQISDLAMELARTKNYDPRFFKNKIENLHNLGYSNMFYFSEEIQSILSQFRVGIEMCEEEKNHSEKHNCQIVMTTLALALQEQAKLEIDSLELAIIK